MTVIEFNIARIGTTEPTYNPDIYVDEDRKVARIAMTLSEISPSRHHVIAGRACPIPVSSVSPKAHGLRSRLAGGRSR